MPYAEADAFWLANRGLPVLGWILVHQGVSLGTARPAAHLWRFAGDVTSAAPTAARLRPSPAMALVPDVPWVQGRARGVVYGYGSGSTH